MGSDLGTPVSEVFKQAQGTSEDSGLSAQSLLARNSAFSKPAPAEGYLTKLNPAQETQFQQWAKQHNVEVNNSATADYDMRGFWLALQKGDPRAKSAVDPNDKRLHYPDYWKTPYDATFSNESKWATAGAPKWNDKDQLVLPNGTVLWDDKKPHGGLKAAPSAPAKPPESKNNLGTPVSAVFKSAGPQSSKLSGALAKVESGGAAALHWLKQTAGKVGVDPTANKTINAYTSAALDQLETDFKKEPSEWKSGVPQGVKVALDVLQTAWAPIQASVDQVISKPIKQDLDKLANLTSRWDEWSPAERRNALANGMQLKDMNEAQQAIKNLKGLVDPALAAVQMLPLPEIGGVNDAVALNRGRAAMRTSSAALRDSLEPPPTHVPVTLSLDKTVGFKGIAENLSTTLQQLPRGTKVNARQLIGQMLPHATGYAKAFLTKLQEHIDPRLTVKYSDQVGSGNSVHTQGVYIPKTHEIVVKQSSPDIIHTSVHEMYHGATVNILDTLMDEELSAAEKAKGSKLTPREITKIAENPKSPMLKELDGIIREARLRWQKAGLGREVWKKIGYGMQPEWQKDEMEYYKLEKWEQAWQPQIARYEFTAELFSNPHLQEFLANSEKYASAGYKFKNMLNQFGVMIGKHLGLTKPHDLQLLNQALSVGSRLMRLQTEKGIVKNRDFKDIVVAHTADGGTITRGEMDAATQMGDVTKFRNVKEEAKNKEIEYHQHQLARLLHDWRDMGITKEQADARAEVHSNKLRELFGDKPIEVARKGARQTAKETKNALELSIEGILRTVAPELLGKNAKLAASVIASRITEQMQATAAYKYGSRTRLRFWRARPDLAREFINRFEAGGTFKDPELARLAKKYKDWNARIAANEGKLGFVYEPRDNYLYHLFTDSEGVANYFERKYGSKWGDPKFIKERTFDMYKEAIAAGFTPVFDNPEDIMLARQQASDIAEMNIGILNDLASYGLATRKIKGETKLVKKIDSEGKVTLDFEETKGNKRPENTVRWRAPNGDVFWVDQQAAVVLENAFKSKSLWADKSGVGLGFRALMTAKNTIVPFRLALSLFHPMHIVGIDIAATMTRQISGMLAGQVDPITGIGKILKAGFDPFYANPKIGWKVMRAMRGNIAKEDLNAADAEALQHLVDGGLILDMSPQYRTNARQSFSNALIDAHADFRMRKPGALAWDVTRATWHAPWALLSAVQKPIFEDWIPMLKGASYLQDVKMLLERNPDLIENRAARQLALRKLAKSAENRYGEMAYNTLFWKRWFKDLAVLNTLSLGWQMGFIREYGGGAMDLGQFVRSSDKLKRVNEGLLDRPIFVASYTTLGAAMGGLMTYGFTGKPPTSIMDYIDPQVGGENPDGTPKRVSTMFYSREFAALYKHIQDQGLVSGLSQLAMNKSSGLFGLMHEWYSGVNSFGEEIRDPNSPLYQELEQTLGYTLADLEPISVSSLRNQAEKSTNKDKMLAALGFTPAPKYITETRSEALIAQAYDKYVAPKETPFDRAEYSAAFRKLRKQYLGGDPGYGDTMDSMIEKYQLSNKDIRRIIKSLNMNISSSVKMFIELPWQQQKVVLDSMPPEERDLYLPHANKEHIRNSYQAPQ